MKNILLIGLSNFGVLLTKQLYELHHQVMAVDKDESRINAILPIVTDAQIGDSTNADFLKSLGLNNYDICVVCIENDFQNSLETTSLLKELGARFVVSCADREVQSKFLLRNGADEVINPEKQVAEWAAIRYTSNHILDYVRLDEDHAIFEVPVPKDWVGMSIGAIDIRKKYGINIMGIKENGKLDLSVTADSVLHENVTLLVLGKQRFLQKCFRI